MNIVKNVLFIATLIGGISACDQQPEPDHSFNAGHGVTEVAPAKGPHGGRLLVEGEFSLELAIFETGVPPEFRAWMTQSGEPIAPEDVRLEVRLTRLGGVVDEIRFAQQEDFLRGDTVIYEPHSFAVSIEVQHKGSSYQWLYDNFEGRTRIEPSIAQAFGLETESAGPATIIESVSAYGRIVPVPEKTRAISARFDGVIQSVEVSVGDFVRRGQVLAAIESNESLKPYDITAPIDGTLTNRMAHPGEQTDGRQLFTLMDNSLVWAELAVFPADRSMVKGGAPVSIRTINDQLTQTGVVDHVTTYTESNQSVLARVVLDNRDGKLVPGTYLSGEIQVAKQTVPIAVKRTGLQSFRDFTVVYALVGEEYEVRMLDLGRQDSTWIEVLEGLELDTRYVTTNSYLIKADIEKSGASHDH